MSVQLDHIILQVNDAQQSIAFFTRVLGFAHTGEDGPFSVIRVSPDFLILLSPFGTTGGEHLAFAMTKNEFEKVFERIKEEHVPFGDAYNTVGNMKGPARERSARGTGNSVYVLDPNKHLIEMLHYEA
jgi:catechol 2,3-dioxygenase-like lactoylglutathione lyase family enzyme